MHRSGKQNVMSEYHHSSAIIRRLGYDLDTNQQPTAKADTTMRPGKGSSLKTASQSKNCTNKWSHKLARMQILNPSSSVRRSISAIYFGNIGASRRQTKKSNNKFAPTSSNNNNAATHQRQHQSSRSSNNLLLSIIIGLLLAAIHSEAFTSGAGGNLQKQQQNQPVSASSMTATSSASSGADQQHQPVASSTGTASSSSNSGSTRPSGPQTIDHMGQSPSINLIPVDQPVGHHQQPQPASSSIGFSSHPMRSGSSSTSGSSSSSSNNNNNKLQESSSSQMDNSINISSRSAAADFSYHGTNGPSSAAQGDSSSSSLVGASVDDATSPAASGANTDTAQAPSQSAPVEDDFSEPQPAHYYADADQYQTIIEQQQQQQQQQQLQQIPDGQVRLDPVKQPLQQQRLVGANGQSVERRFGLFKKGQQQHFGSPAMSANYAAVNPFMSDCERCLAGFGPGPVSGDLQQIDPLPPATLPPQPPPLQLPQGQAGNHFALQPFAPLKSKFFMKFPFFVKPMSLGSDSHSAPSYAATSHYWPPPPPPLSPAQYHHQHHHQSAGPPTVRPSQAMSNALYIRPAPSYNCIQANPPLLAASASTTSQTSEVIPLGSTKSQGGGTKQYAHQQVSYAS